MIGDLNLKTIHFITVVSFVAVLGLVGCTSTGNRANDGGSWQSLFNGKDLTGWSHVNGGTFVATNGLIHMQGDKGWLRTDKEYRDFILEVEWRGLETNFNSGIFVRAPLEGNPWAPNVCQVNLKQSAVGELLDGSTKAEHSTIMRPVNQWTKFRIEARGTTLKLSIDGEPAWEFKDFRPVSGYIGLQDEGRPIDFRNLRVRELPSGP